MIVQVLLSTLKHCTYRDCPGSKSSSRRKGISYTYGAIPRCRALFLGVRIDCLGLSIPEY